MDVICRTFTDPDELAALLHPSRVELIPLGHERFTAELTTVDLPRIRMRRTREPSPRLAHVRQSPGRTHFGFLADETSAPVVVDGMTVTPDVVLRFAQAADSNQHSLGPIRWANISIDRAGLDALGPEIAEQEPAASSGSRAVVPGKSALRRLRRLHSDVELAVIQSPAALGEPEAVRAVENQIVQALVDCLTGLEQRWPTSAQVRHATVMRRFRDLLEANLDCTLYLPEVCAALGVSHRALSYCCHELLGTSPKRYFYLRRMYMVRRTLLQADRYATTVTEIATRYGFWEFGRFSVHYKALFGEKPSATLRRESMNAEPCAGTVVS